MNNYIWVVELQWSKKERWVPTIGVALSRDYGREKLKEWKAGIAGARFRLRKYIATNTID